MSKRNSAPTHGWVISSRITRWLALLFVVFILVLFVTIYAISYSIRRNCQQPYSRDINVLGYWVHINAGRQYKGCVQNPWQS